MSKRSISISSLLTEGDEGTNASDVIFQTQPRLQKPILIEEYSTNNNNNSTTTNNTNNTNYNTNNNTDNNINNINNNNNNNNSNNKYKLQGGKLPELLNPLVEKKIAPTIHRNRMSLSTMINTESTPNNEISTQKIMVHDLLVQEKYPEIVVNDLVAQENLPEAPAIINQLELVSTSTTASSITTPKKRAPRGKNKPKSTNSTPTLPSNSVFLPPTITNINELDSETPQPPPIISINIQLSTHNDAHTDHNFMKLCEDKYGLNVLNPTGKLTVDLDDFNDDLDDEELDNEDTELDREEEPDSGPGQVGEVDNDILKALNLKFKSGMSDEEKETLILKELHRRKMANNKRIGKYDVHDPFIDDEELLFEEETKNNKNGWFVYYGTLLDDDVSVSKKRAHSVVEIGVSDPTTAKKKKAPSTDSVGRTTQNSGRRRLNKEQHVMTNDVEKFKEKGTIKEKDKEQTNDKEKEEKKDKVKRKEKEENKKDERSATKSSDENDNKKQGEDKTFEPIVQAGPVVASSSTSNNKIIIGSFPSFG